MDRPGSIPLHLRRLYQSINVNVVVSYTMCSNRALHILYDDRKETVRMVDYSIAMYNTMQVHIKPS